jgi:HK97 family phage major capsid protein
MAALQELLDEQARIKQELQRMENDDTVTEETDGDLRDTLLQRWEELDAATKPLIARMEKIRNITRAAEDPANLEPPYGAGKGGGGITGGRGPDLVIRNRHDPFDSMERIRDNMVPSGELRERAMDAIELVAKRGMVVHDFAEEATRKVQDGGYFSKNNIARHILETGSPEYYDAFAKYIANPDDMAARAALNLGVASGGYLLPFVLDPTIVLTNNASANPYRRISNVKTTTSNTWNGVTSAGVTAAWLAEGVATADASPTVGNIVITPLKAAAWVFGSFEVLSDTDFGTQLPRLLADAKDRLEEAAFATGTGTAQPTGVVVGATTTQTTATTGAYVLADVYTLHAALPPRFRNSPNCAWVANVAQINRTRALDTAGGASFWTNLGKDQPEQLMGKPIYESSSIDPVLTTTHKPMVFGDFSNYYIVDRVGVSIIYEPMVTGTGASANLPTGQSGWFMYWRVGANVSTPSAFRVLLT